MEMKNFLMCWAEVSSSFSVYIKSATEKSFIEGSKDMCNSYKMYVWYVCEQTVVSSIYDGTPEKTRKLLSLWFVKTNRYQRERISRNWFRLTKINIRLKFYILHLYVQGSKCINMTVFRTNEQLKLNWNCFRNKEHFSMRCRNSKVHRSLFSELRSSGYKQKPWNREVTFLSRFTVKWCELFEPFVLLRGLTSAIVEATPSRCKRWKYP